MRDEIADVHRQYRRDLVLYREARLPRTEMSEWTSTS